MMNELMIVDARYLRIDGHVRLYRDIAPCLNARDYKGGGMGVFVINSGNKR